MANGYPTVSRPKIRFVPCTPWFQHPTELMLLPCVLKRAIDFPTRSFAEPIRSLDSERYEPFQVRDDRTNFVVSVNYFRFARPFPPRHRRRSRIAGKKD